MDQVLYIFEDQRSAFASTCKVFRNPKCILTTAQSEEVKGILDQVQDWISRGYFAAGYITYEAATGFIEKLEKKDSSKPLVKFYIFSESEDISFSEVKEFQILNSGKNIVSNFRENWDLHIYREKFEQLQKHLIAGDCYQLNLSLRQNFDFNGSPYELYKKLRETQKVSYAAFLKDSAESILSFSPELFLKKSGDNLMTKPMKGTSPRYANSIEDENSRNFLKSDEKSLAENLMIVDLLRNDLGKVAEPGSVQVDGLFEVQSFETLHQMITTISAKVDPKISLSDVFKALFPCGSITGAPKLKTMELIEELEGTPRGIYTGAIGFISPNNDFCFNVAIRTIEQITPHTYRLGLGGGVLVDSIPEAEFDECLLKGQFIKKLNESFLIFETMLFDGESFKDASAHKERIKKSCQFFGFKWNEARWNNTLVQLALQHQGEIARFKISVDILGYFDAKKTDILPLDKKIILGSSDHKILRKDIFVYHKTSHREVYDQEWEVGLKNGYYDVVFFNDKDELTEASRHNIFLLIDNQWWTPPVKSGLLPGVERASQMIARQAKEKILYRTDLAHAQKVALTNSVRGWVEVDEVAL